MAAELFWDTSGFFALLNTSDSTHHAVREVAARATAERRRNVTSDWGHRRMLHSIDRPGVSLTSYLVFSITSRTSGHLPW